MNDHEKCKTDQRPYGFHFISIFLPLGLGAFLFLSLSIFAGYFLFFFFKTKENASNSDYIYKNRFYSLDGPDIGRSLWDLRK